MDALEEIQSNIYGHSSFRDGNCWNQYLWKNLERRGMGSSLGNPETFIYLNHNNLKFQTMKILLVVYQSMAWDINLKFPKITS